MEEEPQHIEINEKELGLVGDILKTLTKTVKTFNVYPKDNPIYQKFANEIFEKFNAFFETNNELTLGIEQSSLFYKGNEVYHSEERIDNIPLLLFADGLRELAFQKGIKPEEITDFIDILRFAPKSATSDEDDIVTLLWERNIRNMSYTVVEDTVDDNLAVEEGLSQEDAAGEDIPGKPGVSAEYSAPAPPLIAVASLTDAEIASVKVDLSGIEEGPLLSSAVELFFDLLSSGKTTEIFSEILLNIGKIIDLRMNKGNIKDTIGILGKLKEISVIYSDREQKELITKAIRRAGNEENLRILFRESSNSDEARLYLLFLDRDSIPNMITLLGELHDRKQRRFLCDFLAEAGGRDIDVLSEALRDARWYLVRNITMILGMIKDPAIVPHLEQSLKHPDLRVRREAVKALVGIQSEETKRLLLTALNDDDLTVRIIALKVIRRFRDPGLFKALSEKSSMEELGHKSFEEKKELLETLAMLGGEKAFPILSDLFSKKRLLEKDDVTETRASAAYGLGLLGTPEAISLLEKETGSKKNILRDASIRALRESQKIGNIRR